MMLTYLMPMGESERSLSSTQIAFDGYRIMMNKILLRDQLTAGMSQRGIFGDGKMVCTQTATTLVNGTFSIPLGWLSGNCGDARTSTWADGIRRSVHSESAEKLNALVGGDRY